MIALKINELMKEIKTTLNHWFFLQSNIQVHNRLTDNYFKSYFQKEAKNFLSN